jgi:hypothetical protein
MTYFKYIPNVPKMNKAANNFKGTSIAPIQKTLLANPSLVNNSLPK